MSSTPTAPTEFAQARDAAAVILVRERAGSSEVEVLMVQRHQRTAFMSNAYVFPGGAAAPDDGDLRVTAARELFEEAGILLSRTPVRPEIRTAWRDQLNKHEAMPPDMRASFHAALDLSSLRYYAQWITPSAVPKRFSATFYLAASSPGEVPDIDNREVVEAAWVTPAEGLLRARELHLYPPQVRTLFDLREAAEKGLDALFASAEERSRMPHALLPRQANVGGQMSLLLPWDPEYMSTGQGEAMPLPSGHPLAVGPSRFVREDDSWNHVIANVPDSTNAD